MDTNCQYTAPAQRQQVVLPQPRRQPIAEEFAYRFRPLIDFGCAGIERMVSSVTSSLKAARSPIPLILIRVPARSVPYRRLAGDGRCDLSHCPKVREARFEGSARRYRPRRVCTEGEDSSRKQLLDSVKIIADGSI